MSEITNAVIDSADMNIERGVMEEFLQKLGMLFREYRATLSINRYDGGEADFDLDINRPKHASVKLKTDILDAEDFLDHESLTQPEEE
jgi:hypothetical protein